MSGLLPFKTGFLYTCISKILSNHLFLFMHSASDMELAGELGVHSMVDALDGSVPGIPHAATSLFQCSCQLCLARFHCYLLRFSKHDDTHWKLCAREGAASFLGSGFKKHKSG